MNRGERERLGPKASAVTRTAPEWRDSAIRNFVNALSNLGWSLVMVHDPSSGFCNARDYFHAAGGYADRAIAALPPRVRRRSGL